ncbi:TonB-dependent receptor [Paenimyroides viscosum]|uniref:TonB-dependent receptor n=1 Tax=Paenimyroides viscosum TaxID=2488729 RepID=A0A3P1AR31_9FLAO|nr:TonB-dependent receptor [Paenimyroides viscosum]RRA90333.1 TonB-dependent receptor [Paenimyroides viscosum]
MKKFLAVVVFLITIVHVRAQDSLHTTLLQDLVISTSRPLMYPLQVSDSIFQLPASVARLNPELLQNNNRVEVAPILNTVAGVYMQSGTFNTNRLSIRGIGGRTPYGTNKVRAFYGNIPLTGGNSETTIEDIDLEFLQNIHIIKGPLPSVYGAGLGGAVLLQPKTADPNQMQVGISTTVGSFGLIKNQLSGSYGADTYSFNVGYHKIENSGYRENSSYYREGLTITGEAFRKKKSKLTYLSQFTSLKAYIPSSIDQQTFLNNPKGAALNWKEAKGYEVYKNFMMGLNYNFVVTDNITAATSVFYSLKDSDEPRPFDILKEYTETFGARSQFVGSWQLGGKLLKTTVGVEFFQDGYDAATFENRYLENNGQGSLAGADKNKLFQRRNFVNIYSQLRYVFSEKWELNAGLNYNKTSFSLQQMYPLSNVYHTLYDYNGIWAPQIALSYLPSKQQTIYLSVGRGYSLPSIEETMNENGQVNTSIKPENGYSVELGTKLFSADKRFYAEAALYHMKVNDLLVAHRVLEDQYVGVNAGSTVHMGLEFMAQYKWQVGTKTQLIPYLSVSLGDYTFDDFKQYDHDFSGNDLTGVPKNQFTSGVMLDLPYGFGFKADYFFIDKIPLNDANSLFSDAYSLCNASVNWRGKVTNALSLSVNVGINNIFNERYASMVLVNATGFGNSAPRYYYPGQPVNYFGSFQLRYVL